MLFKIINLEMPAIVLLPPVKEAEPPTTGYSQSETLNEANEAN
ncbi:hypothetical protein [Nostoc sp. JL33]|nr:hypothetical protein [Nostoc sp. JL33]